MVEDDDVIMTDVIEATEKLKETTQRILGVFNHTRTGTGNTTGSTSGSDFRESLVGNTCGVLYTTVQQIFSVMEDKICRIENLAGILTCLMVLSYMYIDTCLLQKGAFELLQLKIPVSCLARPLIGTCQRRGWNLGSSRITFIGVGSTQD